MAQGDIVLKKRSGCVGTAALQFFRHELNWGKFRRPSETYLSA
jgi:hypothetical protein